MPTIPPPNIVVPREEWADTDFDFLDEEPIHASDAESDKDDFEDWDVEMDLGKTGGAKAQVALDGVAARSETSDKYPRMFTIQPPLSVSSMSTDEDEDDEGVSTIKIAALPKISPSKPQPPATIEEDFEDAFALPSDLTQLSLRPLPLSHRESKSSIEWGDKDHTNSSQSSDNFSSLGFADNCPSSNYTSASSSHMDTETEDEDEEADMLDGLVVPTGLFDSGHGAKKLVKLLETKKKTVFTDMRVKVASPDPEDDFEMGLVLDDNMELSPSRLLQNAQQARRPVPPSIRSKSAPARPSIVRPPSRLRSESRAKSPNNPPISSAAHLRKLINPVSPPPIPSPTIRSQTYSQALTANTGPSGSAFLAPKPGSLRVQKSHTGLKPASPPMTRKLTRKASLPSLSDNAPQPSGSSSSAATQSRYNAPTASSRAKTHGSSTSNAQPADYNVPPTRPSTPTSNPAALRLTMPTSSSRLKARPTVTSLFSAAAMASNAPPLPRSASPVPPPRPPSSASNRPPSSASVRSRHGQTQSMSHIPAAKVLKRPKRTRTFGDGTELDEFDDLPLDPQKEGQYRVQPKGYGNRAPGATYTTTKGDTIVLDKASLRRIKKREPSRGSADMPRVASLKTLKRTSRMDLSVPHKSVDTGHVKKSAAPPNSGHSRRKPTLIRNLGGSNAPKVVGEMKWNPQTQRWEGNDQVLRDFDAAVGTSTRPALITHLTGSSLGSPAGGLASSARIVGNMIFDPSRMCWISTLPPEEEEPDVFADLADDEDDHDWSARASTIRVNQQPSSSQTGSESSRTEAPSPAGSHSHSMSETESDRGSRASMVYDVEDGFLDKCRIAEERHRSEMRGWIPSRTKSSEPDRSYLFEIRALATRQY